MKTLILVLLSSFFSICLAQFPAGYSPKDGDILFQSLPHSPLVDAIEGATESPYSHCGVLYKNGTQWVVLEAIGPVKETHIEDWIKQGRKDEFDVFRLKTPFQKHIPDFIAACQTYLGRPYDIRYRMDDENIYCSELLYKGFRDATSETLGKTILLGDLKWENHLQVIIQIEGRVPEEREMITPRHLSEATQLEKIEISAPSKISKKFSKFK